MPASLQPASIPTYKRAWALFNQFLYDVFQSTMFSLPIPPPTLALFIAYLFDKHYAPSSVNTFVSALGYSHKLAGFSDPGKVFLHCANIERISKDWPPLGLQITNYS